MLPRNRNWQGLNSTCTYGVWWGLPATSSGRRGWLCCEDELGKSCWGAHSWIRSSVPKRPDLKREDTKAEMAADYKSVLRSCAYAEHTDVQEAKTHEYIHSPQSSSSHAEGVRTGGSREPHGHGLPSAPGEPRRGAAPAGLEAAPGLPWGPGPEPRPLAPVGAGRPRGGAAGTKRPRAQRPPRPSSAGPGTPRRGE